MPKHKRREWTAEDDTHLRSLLEAGESVTLVADKLKRTVTATKKRANKLRVSLGSRGSVQGFYRAGPEMEMSRIKQSTV